MNVIINVNGRRKPKEHIVNLPNEIWKDIPNCPTYKVSNLGRVLSLAKETYRGRKFDKLLTPCSDEKGYLLVNINGKNERVHRLVALAFCPNPNNYNVINHKNENKSDNRAENLEWCTSKYNSDYSVSIKVKQINPITKEVIAIYNSISDAARAADTTVEAIRQCCNRTGTAKTIRGFIWRKIDDNDYNIEIKNFRKAILMLDINNNIMGRFDSITDAAKQSKISISAISKCLTGKSKTCKGFKWKYDTTC